MDPIVVIEKYYDPQSIAYGYLVRHSRMVVKKALEIAEKVKHLSPDLRFIEEAAMLHDIGIILTNTPEIGCYGDKPYVCHGYLGTELLQREGLPRHALVCERHVGAGITLEDIKAHNLPLPPRDMCPETLEEKIICFADKFYSKNANTLHQEKKIEEIKNGLATFGKDKVERFETWLKMFGY